MFIYEFFTFEFPFLDLAKINIRAILDIPGLNATLLAWFLIESFSQLRDKIKRSRSIQ